MSTLAADSGLYSRVVGRSELPPRPAEPPAGRDRPLGLPPLSGALRVPLVAAGMEPTVLDRARSVVVAALVLLVLQYMAGGFVAWATRITEGPALAAAIDALGRWPAVVALALAVVCYQWSLRRAVGARLADGAALLASHHRMVVPGGACGRDGVVVVRGADVEAIELILEADESGRSRPREIRVHVAAGPPVVLRRVVVKMTLERLAWYLERFLGRPVRRRTARDGADGLSGASELGAAAVAAVALANLTLWLAAAWPAW